MAFRAFIAILMTFFFFSCLACSKSNPLEEVHTIAKWADGDTANLSDGRHLRLIGLDTPETAKKGQKGGYYSREAYEFARKITKQERITVVFIEDKKHPGKALQDPYKRFLCEILLPDGRSLNEEMLRSGVAWFYPFKELPEKMGKRFLAAQVEAIKKHTGCWKKILAMPKAKEPFIGNKNSHRVFTPACAQESGVSPKNQVEFSNLKEALLEGYSPARTCDIWPPENF